MVKKCGMCKEIKDESEFWKNKSTKDGLQIYCKKCMSEISNINYIKKRDLRRKEKNRIIEEIGIENKKCKVCGEIKIIEEFEKHRKTCKKCREASRKEQKRKYFKKYKLESKNIEKIKETSKTYREKNKDKIKETKKRYRKKYFKEINKRKYLKRKKDIVLRLRHNVSTSIVAAMKRIGNKKKGSILKYLPFTIQQLKEHLEKQFELWMNWENYGTYKLNEERKWHIDHIIPHSSFHYETMDCEEFRKCWELSNLRPFEAIENIIKSNKIEGI